MTKPAFPQVSSMLPTNAREAMFRYFLARLKLDGVYVSSNRPVYNELSMYEDIQNQSDWTRSVAPYVYESALKQFDLEHPIQWSNKLQRSWRKGINDPCQK